jgi:DNA-binding beta-propeller fold protein YncE
LVGLLAASAAAGISVPEPVNGVYYSTLLAVDGSGGVYCFDGDTVYSLSGGTFSPLVTGVSAATGASIDPSGFSVNAAGTLAYVATGFSGHTVEVNLQTHGARDLPGALTGGGYTGLNWGLAVDPIYGKVFMADSNSQNVFLVNPSGSDLLSLLKDYGTLAQFGGGIAFAPDGRLIVPVATTRPVWPNEDSYKADIYAFSRTFLDQVAAGETPTGGMTTLASGITISGSGTVAADVHGNVYLLGADAIYKVDSAGHESVFAGDPSVNVFDVAGIGYMGLTYDAATDQLLYAYRASTSVPWQYETAAAPEPATLALLAAGAGLAWMRRRARR